MSSLSCFILVPLLVGFFLGSARGGTIKGKCSRNVDVAIVGAGPSGTYAAYELRKAGLNIELFEYSNRIGGRLFTSSLPNVPDLNLELGGMRFIDGVHHTVQRLAKDLNLTPTVFTEGFGRQGRTRFFLRGKHLTLEELKSGDVPYDLSPEEKANQGRIWAYYLGKLTGYEGDIITPEELFHLRVADGRQLYKLRFDETMDMVASPEGKQFAKDVQVFKSLVHTDCNAVQVFESLLTEEGEIYTLKEGMSSIPLSLVEAFLDASESHKLSLNRHLISIRNSKNGDYKLIFEPTQTVDGITEVLQQDPDIVCAKSVILALPNYALTKLDWKPLRVGKVAEALRAVRPAKASKVFMTFSEQWWIDEAKYPSYVYKSDTDFLQMYDWKQSNVTGDYAMIASYADYTATNHLEKLNSEGNLMEGSAPGAHEVTENLKDDVLDSLADAFGISREEIPEPVTGSSQFWTKYPYGGGWVEWRAGYNYLDVSSTVQRPSLTDDVFIVGADIAAGINTAWTEGAFETVDYVLNRYFF